VGPHGVQAVVPGHAIIAVQGAQQVEACGGPVHHRERDGVVQRDHRVGGHAFHQPVEREDLRPVGVVCAGGLVVDGGDRGLQLVGAER
jgi:hypothetical protein